MRWKPIASSAFGILAAASLASQPVPLGPHFLVNTHTTGDQVTPDVTALPDGSFVVVWSSDSSPSGDPRSIEAQRYSSSAIALGAQFAIASHTTTFKLDPAVTSLTDGRFVVAWEISDQFGGDGSSSGVQARLFSPTGDPLGDDFAVTTYITGHQSQPAIAASGDGGFLVAWRSYGSSGSDTSGGGIQARRFSDAGDPVTPDIQVNSQTSLTQLSPSVARRSSGEFLVVWTSLTSGGTDSSSSSIQGRALSSQGAPIGDDFQINSFTTGPQQEPAVAATLGGGSFIAWTSDYSEIGDMFSSSIQGRGFDEQGAPAGPQFQVNSNATYHQRAPSVSSDSDGEFVVVWSSYPYDPKEGPHPFIPGIRGRRFSSNGQPLGPDFVVGPPTLFQYQDDPEVAVSASGDFLVVWSWQGQFGTDPMGIFGRGFRVTGDLAGRAFHDLDSDGVQDPNDPGLPGVTVELYDDQLALRRSTVSGPDGTYTLKPKAGTWTLKFIAPGPDYVITAQDAGGDNQLDSDADPFTGFTDPFPISINVLESTIDAGFLLAVFKDGFEAGDSAAWSTVFP